MSFTALLLTGGLSRRMGADKATLIWQGEPLWARQTRVLRELRPAALWISARAMPEWRPHDFEVVLDQPPSRGPLSGLAAALERIETSQLFALAIDLPHVTADHLRELARLAEPSRGVVPEQNGRFEPLCAVYPAEAAGTARDALAGGDVSLQTFCRALIEKGLMRARAVGAEEGRFYQNVNTPEDVRGLAGRRRYPKDD